MTKVKKFKNVKELSKEVLSLNDYERWLIDTKNELISTIVKTRKKHGLSQKDLADMLATSQSVISRVENGTNQHITIDYLMKIANTLGLSTKIILKQGA